MRKIANGYPIKYGFSYRGLASQGSDGKLKLKLPNYSYAEDGMLIWDAIYKFAGDYLSLHYKDDVEGQRVRQDAAYS